MKPTPNIYDASQTRDLSKLAPAKGSTMSTDIEKEWVEFEAWWKDRSLASWRATLTANELDKPMPEQWGAGLKRYYWEGWQAACAALSPAPKPCRICGEVGRHNIPMHDVNYRAPAPIQQAQQDSCIPPSRAEPAGAYKHTDLSKRLRDYANSGWKYANNVVARADLLAACDEIDRYYTGMLNWKATAEAKDAEVSAPAGAAKSGDTNPSGNSAAPTVKASQ